MTAEEVEITHVDLSTNRTEKKKDFVATETPLHIIINKKRYVSILCSPNNQKELAMGHLLSEGILTSLEEILELRIKKNCICEVKLKPNVDIEKRLKLVQPFARLITSACGSANYWPMFKLVDKVKLSKIQPKWKINAKTLLESVRQLNKLAETFKKTGAVHVAVIFKNNGELMAYAEDMGRHNAIDKVIGIAAAKNIIFNECFLVSSGRLTGDMVLKAARMHIPIVASIAAAISSGIEVAKRTGITLVGFARGNRFNIYTFPERININRS
jgi:FdhD protein